MFSTYSQEVMLIGSSSFSQLGLQTDSIEQSIAVAVGFAKLVERMRQQAQEEMYAASEWIKWLKYGMFPSLQFANSKKSGGRRHKISVPIASYLPSAIRN